MKYFSTFLLTIVITASFAQNCEKFVTGQFVPEKQNKKDSVYYIITISSIHELHSNKGYRNIFDLKWFDYCSFEAQHRHSSKRGKKNDFDKAIQGSITVVNDSIIELNFGNETKKIKLFEEQSIWDLMILKDNELKKLEEDRKKSLEQYEELFGDQKDSLFEMLGFVNQIKQPIFEDLKLNAHERNAIEIFFTSLRTFDSEKFYSNCSEEFKKEMNRKTLNEYFDYVQNIFGKWEYLSVSNYPIGHLSLEPEQDNLKVSDFGFTIKFENVKDEIDLSLSLENTNNKAAISSLNINSPEFETSPYLNNLSLEFFDLFQKKKYNKIYDNCSDFLKNEASRGKFKELLDFAESARNSSEYKFYTHAFSLNENLGGLITTIFIAELEYSNILLSLTFLSDSDNQKLTGINIKEIKK